MKEKKTLQPKIPHYRANTLSLLPIPIDLLASYSGFPDVNKKSQS